LKIIKARMILYCFQIVVFGILMIILNYQCH